MITQVEQLKGELTRLVARHGADGPIQRALQRQLDGYLSMEVNQEENFLVGTMPKGSISPPSSRTGEPEEDSPEQGAMRIARFKHQNEQMRKQR